MITLSPKLVGEIKAKLAGLVSKDGSVDVVVGMESDSTCESVIITLSGIVSDHYTAIWEARMRLRPLEDSIGPFSIYPRIECHQ